MQRSQSFHFPTPMQSNKPNSPTSVPLPVSPQSSRGDFDALIHLLASDDTRARPPEGGQTDLRDANGHLDFSKIRNMFASTIPSNGTEQETGTTAIQDFEVDHMEGNPVAENVNFFMPSSFLRTSSIPTLNLSPAQRTGISSQAFDDGPPPAESTPVPTARTINIDNITVESSFDPSWDTGVETDDVFSNRPNHGSESLTSSLLGLRRALDVAQREVMDLRRRCIELEDIHASSDISPSRNNLQPVQPKPSFASPQTHPLDEIPSTNLKSPPATDDIRRAVEMVNFVDELVWKRSRFGAKYQNPFCAENIQALRERLELWEQAVRIRR